MNYNGDIAARSLLTDFLPRVGDREHIEARLEDVVALADEHQLPLHIWQFTELHVAESLHQHVNRAMHSPGLCAGPQDKGTLKFMSKSIMHGMGFTDLPSAATATAHDWANIAAYKQQWQAHVKTIISGNMEPAILRGVLFGDAGKGNSRAQSVIVWPAILIGADGRRYWGMIDQMWAPSHAFKNAWGLRDLLAIKYTATCLTVVAQDTGMVLWQNTASMAMFGCHGVFMSQTEPSTEPAAPCVDLMRHVTNHDESWVEGEDDSTDGSLCGYFGMGSCGGESQQLEDVQEQAGAGAENFLELLFGNEKMQQLQLAGRNGDTFRSRVEIIHPALRAWMDLKPGEEAFHKAQASLSRDPITLQRVYIISQIDVTETVIAQRQVQLAHARLAEEKVRMDALIKRQYDLIACLGLVMGVSNSPSNNAAAAELIAGVQKQISGSMNSHGERIELQELLGEGSYGKVYRGLWNNLEVAIKSVMLPSSMSSKEKHQRTAIMEAAISSSLSHPNILQTHTYSLKPVCSPAAEAVNGGSRPTSGTSGVASTAADRSGSGSPSPPTGFEIQLVLEYCNAGSLRDALDYRAFQIPDGRLNYAAVLDTAIDIARGMSHLHKLNVVHSDLKASNVLLKLSSTEQRGLTAKVSDFGLSFKMDQAETHVSSMFQGTQTHMAPEVMESGCLSKAADVYAFGITMWELLTSQRPFHGVNRAHLGYQISRAGLRPEWPADTCAAYADLATKCWQASANVRPTFEVILEALEGMRSLCGFTPRMDMFLMEFTSKANRLSRLASGPSGTDGTEEASLDSKLLQLMPMDSSQLTIPSKNGSVQTISGVHKGRSRCSKRSCNSSLRKSTTLVAAAAAAAAASFSTSSGRSEGGTHSFAEKALTRNGSSGESQKEVMCSKSNSSGNDSSPGTSSAVREIIPLSSGSTGGTGSTDVPSGNTRIRMSSSPPLNTVSSSPGIAPHLQQSRGRSQQYCTTNQSQPTLQGRGVTLLPGQGSVVFLDAENVSLVAKIQSIVESEMESGRKEDVETMPQSRLMSAAVGCEVKAFVGHASA